MEQELLQEGLSALQSGIRSQAAANLSQLGHQYPQSERGWYLLGVAVFDEEQKRY